ncbi:hypothetical protein HJC23_005757 [Cyclotella cryptica]|uniref:Transmembrane protein n=1 Tax=Cyclotella cryptica TaxID=29204 RepID=A0ABD3QEN6_9STRA
MNRVDQTPARRAEIAWETVRAVIGGNDNDDTVDSNHDNDKDTECTYDDDDDDEKRGNAAIVMTTKWIYPLAACLILPLFVVFGMMFVCTAASSNSRTTTAPNRMQELHSSAAAIVHSDGQLEDEIHRGNLSHEGAFSSRANEKNACPRHKDDFVGFLEWTCPKIVNQEDDNEQDDHAEIHRWTQTSLDEDSTVDSYLIDSNFDFVDGTVCSHEVFFTADPTENWCAAVLFTTDDEKIDTTEAGERENPSIRASDLQMNLPDNETSFTNSSPSMPTSNGNESIKSRTCTMDAVTNATISNHSVISFQSSHSKPFHHNTTLNETTVQQSFAIPFQINTNPNYLEFYTHITIHRPTYGVEFLQHHEWIVLLTVIFQDNYKGFSFQQGLELKCDASPREEASCPHSLDGHCGIRYIVCSSQARFWIRHDELLEGLDGEIRRHHQHGGHYVPRTIVFRLFQKRFSPESKIASKIFGGTSTSNASFKLVDRKILTAEVPMNDVTSTRHNSAYTIHLEDESFLEEPEAHDEQLFSQNQSEADSFEEFGPSHSQRESTWETLLYESLCDMVSGMGVLVVVLLGTLLESKIRNWTPGRNGDSFGTSGNSAVVDAPSVRPAVTVNESTLHEMESNAPDNRVIRGTAREAPESPEHDESDASDLNVREAEQVVDSSLGQSFCPRQRQASSRRKMYSRRLGIDLQNSRTVRRSNLTSVRESSLAEDFTGNNVSQTGTVHHALADPSPGETRDDAVFYSPRFDTDAPAPLPHDNAFSQPENTQLGQEAVAMAHTNDSDTSDVSGIQVKYDEPYAPPKITRISDVSPFSNPSPFPPSKVSSLMDLQAVKTRNQEDDNDSEQVENQETTPSVDSQCHEDQLTQPEKHTIDPAFEVSTSSLLKDDSENTSNDSAALATLDETEHDSPASSETTVALDGSPDTVELHPKHEDVVTLGKEGQGKSPTSQDPNAKSLSTKESEPASVPQSVPAQTPGNQGGLSMSNGANVKEPPITDIESASVPGALNVRSPQKKATLLTFLRPRQGKLSQSPTSTVAATVAKVANARRKCSVPLTSDRPQPVRCGTAGRSKKFASLSPVDATNEQFDCIGQRVAKDLDGVKCYGTITDYDGKESPEIWKVKFDDGHTISCNHEDLTEALMHYKIHEKKDPNRVSSNDIDYGAAAALDSHQSSESQTSDDVSNKKTREKKRARVEKRLLRSAKKPSVHKPSSALIPLSKDIEKPVWRYSSRKRAVLP